MHGPGNIKLLNFAFPFPDQSPTGGTKHTGRNNLVVSQGRWDGLCKQHVFVKIKIIRTSVRKKTLGRPTRSRSTSKSEKNVKMDAEDTMDWINLGQNRDKCLVVVNKVIILRVQYSLCISMCFYVIYVFLVLCLCILIVCLCRATMT
jgi:hypothetical protein